MWNDKKTNHTQYISELLIMVTKLAPIILISFSTVLVAFIIWRLARGL